MVMVGCRQRCRSAIWRTRLPYCCEIPRETSPANDGSLTKRPSVVSLTTVGSFEFAAWVNPAVIREVWSVTPSALPVCRWTWSFNPASPLGSEPMTYARSMTAPFGKSMRSESYGAVIFSSSRTGYNCHRVLTYRGALELTKLETRSLD